jgi:hypothetical protein
MAFLAVGLGELLIDGVEAVGFSTIVDKVAQEFKPAVQKVASDTLGNAIGSYGADHPHGFVSKTVDEAYKKKSERVARPNAPSKAKKPKRKRRVG